ncbi:hypothetical protein K435DRAFT_793715 [Dendrothele bispora CBS 962.96]|uniref:Uncharacterized protein n=1 Tax=Dendrothele bispora (strain CBS 962.96) TaxID=1314807 RepID=A0A4S8MF04_DENBC|nr:hypothetical protein K435DRAFT_793715 [Dendrothele bispora CBS 962.96]
MAPSVDKPAYEIVHFLHRRFRHSFTPGGGQPHTIPRDEFADFVDEVSLSVQFLHNAVSTKTLPTVAIIFYRECIGTLLLSFSTNQVPVPAWCPGWPDLDKFLHIQSQWDPSTDLPRSSDHPVAAPPATQQQDQPSTQPPPYSATQNPIPPSNQPLLASPSGFGLPQATRVLRSSTSTPKNQPFGQPSTLLRNIAGTPINTNRSPQVKFFCTTHFNTFCQDLSNLQHETGSSPFLAPKQPTSTSTSQNPISGRSSPVEALSSPVAVQDDELVSSSPERPLASMFYKTAATRPIPNPICPGTFAPYGKQRKTPVKPPVARPPRSPTPEPAPQTTPEPSTSDPKGKKRARPESDFEDGPQSDDPLLDPPSIPTIRLPPREHSSPETIQRRQAPLPTQTTGTAGSDLRVIKKPKLVEKSSEDNANGDGSQDESSEHEPEPEPKTSKAKKAKKKPGKKAKVKPTTPAVRRQQQERYRNAAFPGLAWSADLQLLVIDNAEAFKNFKTSLVQTVTKECEGRGPGEKNFNQWCPAVKSLSRPLNSASIFHKVLNQIQQTIIASQLNRLLSLQENMETEAQAMMQCINHFDREVVILRGMMKDVLRVLWQIEQANPDFVWTNKFLLRLAEIAGWTIAPTVEQAMELARRPSTGMMRRFYAIYPDTANIGCSRSADEVAYEAEGMQLRYPDEGADSASQALRSSSSR